MDTTIQEGVASDIDEYGWHVIKVLEGEETEPAFAYSIGFKRSLGHPEIIMVGLDLDLMHSVINDIGDQIKKGRQFSAGERVADLLEGYDCMFSRMDERWYDDYLGQALEFYGDDLFEMLQCLWPDRNGHFPGEPDFAPQLRMRQPLLSE